MIPKKKGSTKTCDHIQIKRLMMNNMLCMYKLVCCGADKESTDDALRQNNLGLTTTNMPYWLIEMYVAKSFDIA